MIFEDKNKYILRDISFWSLLASNLIVIAFAIFQGWSFRSCILIFWMQGFIIGFFNVIRIFTLKDECYQDEIEKSLIKNVSFQRIQNAIFFMMHFGFFLVFTFFIVIMVTRFDKLEFITPELMNNVFIGSVIFFINHLFSFIYNFKEMQGRNLGIIFLAPYGRMLPLLSMFFVAPLFLGLEPIPWAESIALPFFLLVKTIFDIVTHIVRHKFELKKFVLTAFFIMIISFFLFPLSFLLAFLSSKPQTKILDNIESKQALSFLKKYNCPSEYVEGKDFFVPNQEIVFKKGDFRYINMTGSKYCEPLRIRLASIMLSQYKTDSYGNKIGGEIYGGDFYLEDSQQGILHSFTLNPGEDSLFIAKKFGIKEVIKVLSIDTEKKTLKLIMYLSE